LNVIDIILIGLILIGFILGYKDGFVRKLIGLVGFALAIFLSIRFSVEGGKMLESATGIEFYLSRIIAGFVIFLIMMILTSLIKRLIHPFDKVNNFLNQLFGGIFGVIQILFFLSAVLFLLHIFDVPSKKDINNSLLYSSVYSVIPLSVKYIDNYAPQSKSIIKRYFSGKDSLLIQDSTATKSAKVKKDSSLNKDSI
jgi:membrane protein required for colicin V production